MAIKPQFANTQDLVYIEEIRDNTVILKSGSLRQVIIVGGINTALKSEQETDLMSLAYQNFLNSLDFPIQIVIHSRKINIDRYLDALEQRKQEETTPLLQSQISEYREFIAGFVHENEIMEKIFFVVVTFSPIVLPGKESISGVAKLFPFLNRNKQSEQTAKEKSDKEREESFRENFNQLTQRVNQVTEGLKSVGLEAAVLENQELIELYYNFYNPEAVEKERLNIPGASEQKNG